MQEQADSREEKRGELIAYIPPILPPQDKREQARRAYALACYRKAAQGKTARLFGIA